MKRSLLLFFVVALLVVSLASLAQTPTFTMPADFGQTTLSQSNAQGQLAIVGYFRVIVMPALAIFVMLLGWRLTRKMLRA